MKFDKVEMLSEGAASVMANRPAMKTLAILAEKFGMDAVYGRLADGDMRSIAEWISECRDYDGPAVEELEDELLSGGAFNVEVQRYDRRYRVAPDGYGVVYRILTGDEVGLRLESREAIESRVKGMPGFVDGKPLMQNFYNVFATACLSGHYRAICGAKLGEQAEKPAEGDGPQDGQAPQRIVRETVVIKEEPPVLENMLRQALADQLVKMNLDEVHETVKRKLIDEFGFEPERHVVKVVEVEREVDEVVHERFDEVLHYTANDVPVYLYGPCGSGKGVLGRQVATALGLDYHFMTSVTDEFKINGYMDAYGVYHDTPFYRAFKRGGVFFLDEMDASAPEVLVCLNMAISDRRYAFPHETVEAHPDFRVMAAGNTLGTGADASYTGRMQLDAASLNRFAVVEVGYDEKIDRKCAGGDEELVQFAKAFRKVVATIGLPSACSYRNISQIRVAKEALPLERALSSCICKEMNGDDVNMVAERLRNELVGNPYVAAFAKVKPMGR